MTARSWVARHPSGFFGVRCDDCVGGWFRDTLWIPVLRGDPVDAELVRLRHDRHEHNSAPLSQTRLGGGR